MLLTSITDQLLLVTTTSTIMNIQVGWADIGAATFLPGRKNTIINSATTTTIIDSPAASTQRQIKTIVILNVDSINLNKISIYHSDGATSVKVFEKILLAGEAVEYNGSNWMSFDVYGNFLQSTSSPFAVGNDKEIQFNSNGVLSTDADLTWNKVTNEFGLNGSNTSMLIQGITNEPSASSSGVLRIYSKAVAGRMLPKWIGPSGLNSPFQPALFGNNIVLWTPTTATAGFWQGTAGAGAGTYSTALPTITNNYTTVKRARWTNVITTTNQILGQRNTEAMFFRGSTGIQGGFFFFCRFGLDIYTQGSRLFVGMHTSTAVVSAEPNLSLNICGFGFNSTDSAITFIHNDAVGVAVQESIPTQPTLANNNGYDAYIFCAPNDTTIYFRLDDLNAGVTLIDSFVNSDLPVNTTMLAAGCLASNAALTPVSSIQIGLNRIYVETDK